MPTSNDGKVVLSPLQHGLLMGYVQRVPTKVQKFIPTIPKVLDKIPSQLFALIGVDITAEQKAKIAILEKQPEEILAKVAPETLHAYVNAVVVWLSHLLEMDHLEGIGTGNGSTRPTGFQSDNSSGGVSEREINADRTDGATKTAEPSQIADVVH